MATGRKQMKKKHMEDKPDKKVFDFTQEDEKKALSGSEDDVREGLCADDWLGYISKSCFPDINLEFLMTVIPR